MVNFKKLLFSIFLLSSITFQAQKADAIIGIWETEKGDAKIEVFKSESTYKAKLLWGKDAVNKDNSSKKDINNPDQKLRNHDLIGSIIIKDLIFDDNEWSNGHVYNNANGKWYKCYVWLEKSKFHLRGYLGLPAFGQTTK